MSVVREHRITSVETSVLADYGQFFVEDEYAGPEIPLSIDVDEWFVPLEVGARLQSWHDFNVPDVTMESWTGPPPPLDESWERVAEHEIVLPNATARLRSLNGERAQEVLVLPLGRTFRMRAATRGHAAILAAAGSSTLPLRHIEQWILQFH